MFDVSLLNKKEIERYGRQIILPEFGVDSQYKLKELNVFVVGFNDISKSALIYLAASGVQKLGIYKNSEEITSFKHIINQVNSIVEVEIVECLYTSNNYDVILLNDNIEYCFLKPTFKAEILDSICSLKIIVNNDKVDSNSIDIKFSSPYAVDDLIGIFQATEVIKYVTNISDKQIEYFQYDVYENKASYEYNVKKGRNVEPNKKSSKSVLIIGCGGLGCPAAHSLAKSQMVSHIGLVDDDCVEESNLHRQVYHTESRINLNKAESLSQHIQLINPEVIVKTFKVRLSPNNALDIIEKFDIILDCTDNLPTSYLVSDCCVLLGNKPLVKGNALKLAGHLSVYCMENSPCYRCIIPVPPESPGSCAEQGVLGTVPGFIGTLQAIEAIKLIAGTNSTLSGKFMFYNAINSEIRTFKLGKKKPSCISCGEPSARRITHSLVDYQKFCGVPYHDGCLNVSVLDRSQRITIHEYQKILDYNKPHLLIDVRPKEQRDICKFSNSIDIFHGDIELKKGIDQVKAVIQNMKMQYGTGSTDIYVICRRGNDSQLSVELLTKYLIEFKDLNIKDIIGGIGAFCNYLYPDIPIY